MPNNGQKTDNDAATLHFVRDEMSEYVDLYHHDQPERHRFGLAFHNPVDPQPVGTTAFPGISDTPAREDHVHAGATGGGGGTPATTVTSSIPGDTSVVGTGTNYAREDHKHGREPFGAVAASVVFGQAASNGTNTAVSHSDHVHGTPNNPLPVGGTAGQVLSKIDASNYNTQWTTPSAGGGTPASTVTNSAPADLAVVGTSTNYAREDHKHGRESFGAVAAATSFGMGASNGTNTALARSDHLHGTPVHDDGAHAAIHLNSLAAPNGLVNMNNQRITNVATPTGTNDGVNKAYVDAILPTLSWKQTCRLATTANITLSGAQSIDGVVIADNDRVLVKNQTLAQNNGIYVASTSGAWLRPADMDAASEILGSATIIQEGTTQADTLWYCTTNAPITLGSTNLVFTQFTGGGTTYIAGAGLTLTGSTIDVVAADTSLTVAADSIAVNTAVIATVASLASYAKKYAGALTGTASPEVITHNLNTRDIMLTVLNGASPYTAVDVDWDATTVNTATIRYNPNLGAGYRVVVTG